MTVFLASESAWNYWRRTGQSPDSHTQPAFAAPLPALSSSAPLLYESHVPCLDPETTHAIRYHEIPEHDLEVVVPTARNRRKDSPFVYHVLGCKLPHDSFLEITPHLYICSPELTFLQMASNKDLSLERLILRGFELCGIYGRALDFAGNPKPIDRKPLTSVSELSEYIEEISLINAGPRQNVRGVRRAREALRFIADNSASHRESILTMLLCMPMARGGFGIPLPTSNECMVNGAAIYRDTGRHALVSDLYWSDHKIDVEYDSNEHHLHREQRYKDDTKRNALLDNGFTVFTANAAHIHDPNQTEVLANQLKRAMHIRVRTDTPKALMSRSRLRAELLATDDDIDSSAPAKTEPTFDEFEPC